MDYKNLRRDLRYAVPAVRVIVGASEYGALNWSLGGLLLGGAPAAEVGSQFAGQIRVGGGTDSLDMAAEVLRLDPAQEAFACRFIEPSPALVGALDAAVVARLAGRAGLRRGALGAALVLGMLMSTSHAIAGSPGSVALVPGGFPLPEFHLNFPDSLAEPLSPGPSDLRISLTTRDKSVLQFLFSPRPEFAIAADPGTGTSRSAAGLSWNLFDNNGFYGSVGLAGSITRMGFDDSYRRYFGPPLAVHGMFELGYQIGARHSLTLSLDHATAPDLSGDHNDINNFQLRYGLKF